MNTESNGENDPPSSSSAVGPKTNRHSAPIRSRRSSSRISIRSSSSSRNQPNRRGRISKAGSIPRRTVKSSSMREVTNKVSQGDIPDSHESDLENSCDASVASADTVIEPSPSMTKTKGDQVMKHFTWVHDISQWYYHSIFFPCQTIGEDTLLDIYYRLLGSWVAG